VRRSPLVPSQRVSDEDSSRVDRIGLNSLSRREIEVLTQVSQGMSNKDIGEKLGLSALTVKSHLARIARKLGTGDRAHMVALLMRAQLIR
jgi:DNA-binding NarL/FixJ family response regulator